MRVERMFDMRLLKGLMIAILASGLVYADEDVDENNNDSASVGYQPDPLTSSSYTQVTGFYAGVDVGLSNLKNKMSRQKNTEKTTYVRKNKKKNGFSGDIFLGYNFQMGRFIFGAECLLGMESAKPVTIIRDGETTVLQTKNTELTTPGESASLKRKYTFGFVPRFGYAICGGLNAYVNLGTMFAKYSLKHKEKKEGEDVKSQSKNKGKASLLVGLGVEQNFGSLFVRAECNKIFKRNIATVGNTKVGSESYVVKLGAGYRF